MIESLLFKEFTGEEGGKIIPIEFKDLPFTPKRMFTIHSVPTGAIRGNHAHKTCHQILFCISGQFILETESREGKFSVIELERNIGYYAKPLTWLRLKHFHPGTVVVVLTSHPYDLKDYINDYGQFKELIETDPFQ